MIWLSERGEAAKRGREAAKRSPGEERERCGGEETRAAATRGKRERGDDLQRRSASTIEAIGVEMSGIGKRQRRREAKRDDEEAATTRSGDDEKRRAARRDAARRESGGWRKKDRSRRGVLMRNAE